MAGGLIQLVTLGYEDLYLTTEPEVTFFKRIYKRHTNFSLELIPQLFNTIPDFGKRVTCNISKNADLLSNIYLYIELPNIPKQYDDNNELSEIKNFAWCKNIGCALINYIELEIGGQLIDKHYGDWLNIWNELTVTNLKKSLNKMNGNVNNNFDFSNGKSNYKLYIPLNFWFCRHKGLALPLIALHFSDIKIHVEFNELENIIIPSPTHYINIEDEIIHFKKNDVITQNIGSIKTKAIFSYYDYTTNRLYYNKYDGSLQSYTGSTYTKENYRIYNEKRIFYST